MNAKKLYYLDRHFKRLNARNDRLAKPSYANSSNMVAALREYYSFRLGERDQIKFDLIQRYEEKVSPQLKYEKHKLKEKGNKQGKEIIRDLIYSPSPLLRMIPKSEFKESPLPLPFAYGGRL